MVLAGIITLAVLLDWLTAVAVTIFIIGGLYEFFTMLQKKGFSIYKYFGIAMGIIIPLSIAFNFRLTRTSEFMLVVLALLSLILMQFKRRQSSGVIVAISTTVFGILYVSWFFSFLIKIRYMAGGAGLLTSIILITKSSDIGAYLIGSRFGRIPLIPHISPKKTVEGSIGGLILSVLSAIACQPFLNLNYAHLIFLGLALGILGQLGDLSESLMKRDCAIKDSGSIFPGMGGFLDAMDSLLFSAPVFYLYINIILK